MDGFLLPTLTGLLLVLLGLLALAAYSLRDFSRSRLDDVCRRHNREARFGVILKRHEDALLIAEALSGLILIVLATVLFIRWGLGRPAAEDFLGWVTYLLELVLAVAVLLSAAVVFPWTISRVAGEAFLYQAWPVINSLVTLLKPIVATVRLIDTFVHRLGGVQEPVNGDAAVITEEIRSVVDEGQREGVLESEARTMIHRVMELQQEDAAAVMTPRTEMVCIPVDSTLEEARQRLLKVGHSRVPVVGETTDDIVGILYAKDLLQYMNSPEQRAEGREPENTTRSGASGSPLSALRSPRLRDILREPLYVPETIGIDTLLETMKREHVHFAIVIDEYGGVAGLVTMEDILEEIVGEIVDEYDLAEEQGIHLIAPGVTEVEARVHIDDLNEQFGYNLPEDGDFDTVGGFVFTQLGRIPKPGESFTWGNLKFTVLEAEARKLHKLRIELQESLAATASDET